MQIARVDCTKSKSINVDWTQMAQMLLLQHGLCHLCPGQTLESHKSDMLGLSTGEAQAPLSPKKVHVRSFRKFAMPGLNRMRNWLHSCVGHLNILELSFHLNWSHCAGGGCEGQFRLRPQGVVSFECGQMWILTVSQYVTAGHTYILFNDAWGYMNSSLYKGAKHLMHEAAWRSKCKSSFDSLALWAREEHTRIWLFSPKKHSAQISWE